MNATKFRPRWVPLAVVEMEELLKEQFLSDDLDTICKAAGTTGAVILITTAAHPLKERKAAFKSWQLVERTKFGAYCPEFAAFLEKASDEVTAKVSAAEFSWEELERLVAEFILERDNAEHHRRVTTKKNFIEGSRALVRDPHPTGRHAVPSFCILLEDGTSTLFEKQGTAKHWAKSLGRSYVYMDLRLGSYRRYDAQIGVEPVSDEDLKAKVEDLEAWLAKSASAAVAAAGATV